MRNRTGLIIAAAGAFALVALSGMQDALWAQGDGVVDVQLPESLSANAEIGRTMFEAKCAVCHGASGAGQDGLAPPLIHRFYEPNHHADEAIQRAVAMGVQQHHWDFGDMPPVSGLTRGDVQMIIAYIREVQRANGIE